MTTRNTIDGRVTKASRKRSDIKTDNLDLSELTGSNGADAKSPISGSGTARPRRGIIINGERYACAACKAGHRVSFCTHWRRPMIKTNGPGRPAAGKSKKNKCECAKTCSCPDGEKCDCPRDCTCIIFAVFLDYYAAPDESPPPSGTPENGSDVRGQFAVGETVPVDLKGNPLSPEEARRREQQKEAQLNAQDGSQRHRSSSSATTKSPLSPSQAKPKASGGGCCHGTAIAKENQEAPQPESAGASQEVTFSKMPAKPLAKPPASALFHGCNCGAACSCAFCPQHPNNHVSQNLARQHANMFMNHSQSFDANLDFLQLSSDLIPEASCMGPITGVVIGRDDTLTNPADLQQHFPSNNRGVVMRYRLERRFASAPQVATYDHTAESTHNTDPALALLHPMENENSWNNFHVQDATLFSGRQGNWFLDTYDEQPSPHIPDLHNSNLLSPHLDANNFNGPVQNGTNFEPLALSPEIADQLDQMIQGRQGEFIGIDRSAGTTNFESVQHSSGVTEAQRPQQSGPLLLRSTYDQLVTPHEIQNGTVPTSLNYAHSAVPFQAQNEPVLHNSTFDYSVTTHQAQNSYLGPTLSGSPDPTIGWFET